MKHHFLWGRPFAVWCAFALALCTAWFAAAQVPPTAPVQDAAVVADGSSDPDRNGSGESGDDGSGEGSSEGSGEGAGDGSGEGVGDGSGESAPEPPAAEATVPMATLSSAAQGLAAHVRERAVDLSPQPRNARVAIIRAGEVSPTLAAALELPLAQLTSESGLGEARAAFEARGGERATALEQAIVRHRALVSLANGAFNALRRRPDPYVAARLLLFRQLAAQSAQDIRDHEGELRVIAAALEFFEARAAVLAAAVPEEVSDEVAQQTTEIAAERERLEAATAVTDAMAQRAEEAEARARAEREAAQQQDAVAQRIAERWEQLAPRLRRVVDARTAEQDNIAVTTLRREAFAAEQIERAASVSAVLGDEDEESRSARADVLLDVLAEARSAVRESARERRANMDDLRDEVAAARHAVEDARRAMETTSVTDSALNAELRAQLREVANEEVRVLEEELGLAELRYATAQSLWSLNEAQIHFYGRNIDLLVPHVSRERRRALFALNAANFAEARRNLGERIVAMRLLVADWFKDGDNLASGRSMTGKNWVRVLLLGLALFMFVRTFPRSRDAIIVRLLQLRQSPRFRRFTPALLKLGEIIHECLDETALLVGLYAVSRMVEGMPTVHMLVVWFFWFAIYRFLVAVLATLVIPRSAREPVLIGEPPNEVRLGVDLFDHSEHRGRLILRSARLVLLYLVVGRVGLAAVRVVFGPGFFFYWIGWLFNLALLALIYAIAWYWRKEIVESFVAKTGERSKRLGEWINAHQGKFYSVLVVIALGTYLVLAWSLRLLADWLSGRGIGRFVANFAVRKKLERAADAANVEAVKRTVLPVAYQRVFTDRPLTDEAFLIPRDAERTKVLEAYETWNSERRHGTVAVTGDAGAGKTTFGNALARALSPKSEPADSAEESAESDAEIRVLQASVGKKLLSADAVHQWVRDTFALECEPSRDVLIDALEDSPRCVVVVDQCENLFLRSVGGFDGVDEFLDFCTLTNHRVFWVLIFDKYPWNYLHRVRDRRGYFREIVPLRPFNDERLRAMIEARNETVGVHPNFDRLVGEGTEDTQHYELVKTAGGFFRLLAEYSRGNLRVALHYWLQSLVKEPSGSVHVTLFARPPAKAIKSLSDDQLFALTALAQHRSLTVPEIARALDVSPHAAAVLVNLLSETGYVQACGDDRVRIATHTYFVVLNRLREENFLHLD